MELADYLNWLEDYFKRIPSRDYDDNLRQVSPEEWLTRAFLHGLPAVYSQMTGKPAFAMSFNGMAPRVTPLRESYCQELANYLNWLEHELWDENVRQLPFPNDCLRWAYRHGVAAVYSQTTGKPAFIMRSSETIQRGPPKRVTPLREAESAKSLLGQTKGIW